MIDTGRVHAPQADAAGGERIRPDVPVYHIYKKGMAPVGAIVVELYHSGGEIRGFVREIGVNENDDHYLSSGDIEVDTAFRFAGNKNPDAPDQRIYVELVEGVEWDPAWGTLV